MSDSDLIEHRPCEACGSSDANAAYTDGHTHCFSCGVTVQDPENSSPRVKNRTAGAGFLKGEPQALLKRNLDEATCQKFGYLVGTHHGRPVQIANYRDAEGKLIAQKVRGADKEFSIIGDGKGMPLWGAHLWPASGRRIVITEGELDCLSVAQATGLKWPVVSLPGGAPAAKKAIQRALDWLSGYETIVLCFDMDDPGRKAASECAALFKPGQCAIADLPLKDSNEMIVAGQVRELSTCLWNAREYRPDGIVNAADVWERVIRRQKPGLPYPWAGLTAMTHGQQPGTLVTWTAGTGCGKSTAVAQVAYELAFTHGQKVGYVALEEDVGRAAQRFISMKLGKPCHLEGVATLEEMREAFDATLATKRVFLYDHFGTADSDDLIAKLRYLAKGCGCQTIVLDHLSIVVSGMSLADDERRTIDQTVTRLRTLVEETGITLHMISHLRKAGGDQGFEDGAKVTLSALRGSAAIAQLSDIVIGIERDLQGGPDATVKVLKNRTSGDTGTACTLTYDKATGQLTEATSTAQSHGFRDEQSGGSNPDF